MNPSSPCPPPPLHAAGTTHAHRLHLHPHPHAAKANAPRAGVLHHALAARARQLRSALVSAACALLAIGAAHAAGGHHAVDDAALMEPGQCQVEVWAEHSRQHRLQHIGPACYLGGVEVGFNLDRNAQAPAPTLHLRGVQAKWARELTPGLSAGVVAGASWQSGGPPERTSTLLLPLTWQPHKELLLHLNLGRDFRRAAADLTRRGVALEWQPHAQWQGLVEWFDDGQRLQRRAGLRYLPSNALSLDLSRAQALTGGPEAWWTLGLTWTWDR